MRLNGIGIDLDAEWDVCLDVTAAGIASAHGLPPWCMLAGEHGEYELVFAVPPDAIVRLEELSRTTGRTPVRLGTAVAEPGLRANIAGMPITLDLPAILEAVGLARTDPLACIRGLQAIHDNILTESVQNRDRAALPSSDIAL
jgi:hypothetical protein